MQDRLLVTADKKLAKFLAASGSDCPSVLITREMRTLPAERVAALLIANLPQIERIIREHGNAVFSLAPNKPIRAELLPLGVTDKPTQSPEQSSAQSPQAQRPYGRPESHMS